ncbi:MAG: SusC/RagA family TonB-linked outer membrane protein [Chitinispirillaceae bacterium]|nr:SusC/RagA family TonB-linked outer membrane protein [Chitinispirillaceae bacterium]
MKIALTGIHALVVAGFLGIGSYGQDTVTVAAPVNPTDSNAAASSVAETPSAIPGSPASPVAEKPDSDSARTSPTAVVTETPASPDTIVEAQTPVTADTVVAPTVVTAPAVETVVAGPMPDAAASGGEENVLELEKDVVVGYGTMKKEDLTGSVVSVKADDLVKDAAFSIRKALQGRAAGVNVTQNSGAPGKAMTVRIRGVGTINNSDPLYVVDGVPMTNIDFLNPNDIESITILKDASATAIYGSRGANGVVMVSTKKAREGVNRVTYDMYYGMQQPWKKPSLCNAEQWAILNNEAMRAANLPVYPGLADPSGLGEGTDWFGLVSKERAIIQQQNVSVARGTEKLKYFLSGGYFNQEGILKGSNLEKITFRFNTENKIADWITLGNNFGIAHFNTDYIDESDEWNSLLVNTIAMDPVTRPRNDSGNLVPSIFNNMKNPVGILENTNINAERLALTGTLYSNINLFNVLKVTSTFGLDMAFGDSTNFLPLYYISPSDNQANAVITRKTSSENNFIFENTVSFERVFAEDHTFKVMAGATAQERTFDSVLAQNQSLPSNDSAMRVLDATTGLSPRVNGLLGGNALASGFGRLEYDYGNRYLLTATFRRDGSSRFAPENRWGNFPSVAGAWKISQEPFMNNMPFIEGMKLRVGWGKTGNQEIPDYLYTTTTSGKQDYPFGNTINSGTTFLSSGNPQIHWEAQQATNAGLDLTVLGGRIEFLSDFFIKKTTDMLVQPPIPFMAGLKTPPMVNGGSIENRGMELVLNYKESIGTFFSNVGINFSTYSNKVLSLGSDTGHLSDANFKNSFFVTRTEGNYPIGSFYGYKTNGLFQTWDEINSFTYVDKDGKSQLVQPNAAPGDIRYRDDNHDGAWDQGYIGSPHPDFIMGMSADASYRGFDFSLSLQGVYGNQIFNGTRWYMENNTALYNLDTRMLDRWTGEGSTNDVNNARMNNKDANNIMVSDRYIEDGSYVRLKTMQLGYTLSDAVSMKFLVKKCRVYIGAENLLTWTRYTGLEPEVGLGEVRGGTKNASLTMGVDRTTYPQARTYVAGLNITL